MLHIHIPNKKYSSFSLFAKTHIEHITTVDEKGSFIESEGIAVLFYKFPHHRRCYIVKEYCDQDLKGIYLPNVSEKVCVLTSIRGKRIDELRFALWNLENFVGTNCYLYSLKFWWRICGLLDNISYRGKYKKSALTKLNLILLLKRIQENPYD